MHAMCYHATYHTHTPWVFFVFSGCSCRPFSRVIHHWIASRASWPFYTGYIVLQIAHHHQCCVVVDMVSIYGIWHNMVYIRTGKGLGSRRGRGSRVYIAQSLVVGLTRTYYNVLPLCGQYRWGGVIILWGQGQGWWHVSCGRLYCMRLASSGLGVCDGCG